MSKKKKGGVPPAEHRFKPGQSGNPNGRPKKNMWELPTDIIRETDEFAMPDKSAAKIRALFPQLEGRKITLHMARILQAQVKAAAGSIRHAEWLENRGYGSVPTTIEMEQRPAAVDLDAILAYAVAEEPK